MRLYPAKDVQNMSVNGYFLRNISACFIVALIITTLWGLALHVLSVAGMRVLPQALKREGSSLVDIFNFWNNNC